MLLPMPRSPRDFSAGTFHVTAHAVWGNTLFRDTVDYLLMSTELARTIARSRWRCLAFCFLGTHYHVLSEVEDNALPTGMQRLNNAYARNFNRRYGRDARAIAQVEAQADQLYFKKVEGGPAAGRQ